MKKYEVVERPTSDRGRPAVYPLDAIAATVDTGKAIRIPLNGATARQVRSAVSASMNNRGFASRSKKDGDALIVWVERPREVQDA